MTETGMRGITAILDINDGSELLFCPWKPVIEDDNSLDQHDNMNSDVIDSDHNSRDDAEKEWWFESANNGDSSDLMHCSHLRCITASPTWK